MSKRIGLPVTLKMRHDAHYVETLTSFSGASVGRMIPIDKIRPNPDQPRKHIGDVRELAEVKVNGQSCGIVWAPPFRVDISRALKPGANQLEIEVVNFWPNRIIGDQSLPETQRLTKTNVRKLTAKTPLMPSGLLGPVRITAAVATP